MNSATVVIGLLTFSLFAGCVAPEESTGGAVQDRAANVRPARLAITSLSASPDTIQLGDAVTVVVSVDNTGASAGSGVVSVASAGGAPRTVPVDIGAGASRDYPLDLVPLDSGRVEIRASLGTSERVAFVSVLAPDLGDALFEYEDLACEDVVPFAFSVRNNGDGLARDATARVVIYNDNNVAQDTQQISLGTIAPGSDSEGHVELFAPDTCLRDDYVHVSVEVRPRFGDAFAFETGPFSI